MTDQSDALSRKWLDIWGSSNELCSIVEYAIAGRALPGDRNKALVALGRFTEEARAFLDQLSESGLLPNESQSSSSDS